MILPFSLLVLCSSAFASRSDKRGLIYIATKDQGDDKIWTKPGTGINWYYNYLYKPTPSMANSGFQYIPMLWGKPQDNAIGEFYSVVKSLKESGQNISHVLGFNEPDGSKHTGGSAISASDAAKIWQKEMEPVKDLDVQLGAPAVQGSPDGIKWLQDFVKKCNKCKIDFFPVHWYGPSEGFVSHIGNMRAAFGNQTFWVTEYAYPKGDLKISQTFYNQSTDFMDKNEDITRYSYFGSFRSDKSNIGPAAAMLTQKGQLTDIGSWYLGGKATGNVPKGDSSRTSPFNAWLLVIGLLCIWMA